MVVLGIPQTILVVEFAQIVVVVITQETAALTIVLQLILYVVSIQLTVVIVLLVVLTAVQLETVAGAVVTSGVKVLAKQD